MKIPPIVGQNVPSPKRNSREIGAIFSPHLRFRALNQSFPTSVKDAAESIRIGHSAKACSLVGPGTGAFHISCLHTRYRGRAAYAMERSPHESPVESLTGISAFDDGAESEGARLLLGDRPPAPPLGFQLAELRDMPLPSRDRWDATYS